ncbi:MULTISPECIES: hypothetical protein [unclassified Cryobacterium]|uniref:hypothetical protein n=1 Tax=unclassified Cryobacterium TaxID=2649013 RepID=UPI002AB3DCB1|nr:MULTISPECIES: hypothetical protein [unclassified Cryobacterium]MDY7528881.1 hypothetical protein [Cryobacterium sp. 10C2]MDY7555378.1 hypothetical protein [Cryobacterium sp. 10C3]MEB0200692.1 hypothetical protein [Cryobacterium sp. 5I3]MEB0292384.1 hypothetical protein [Cryobacterium sp. 10C2]WPX12642.1 hypothetical protein RHM57_13280 [Cryobacterium sp. 10S3]
MKDSETLGRQARRVIRTPVYAAIGIVIGVLSVVALVLYWIAPSPALMPIVSTVVPVAVIAYLAVVFTIAARTKEEH